MAREIEERPVSIPQVIHQMLLTFHSEQLGIVTPIYGHEMPTKVRQFLQKADFRCNYFYLILTYGNRHGGASELAKQFCDACGITVDYINVLCMVDNWLPSFDMDEQRQIDKQIDVHLSAIKEDIAQHRKMITAVTEEDRAAHREFLSRMAQMPGGICSPSTTPASAAASVNGSARLLRSGSSTTKPSTPRETVRPAWPASTPVRTTPSS